MRETHSLWFASFRLDLGAEQLWHGAEVRPLTRKAFATLRYLLAHAGQLVTKDALTTAVWALPYVSDTTLATCIYEIRRALEEPGHAPRYVETVRGRGYRFVAPVTATGPSAPRAARPPELETSLALPLAPLLVGREAERTRLQQRFAQACAGTRQVVWVTGEAGIGKTTLMEALLARVAATTPACIGRGQCIEQSGASEAYLPLLEALGQLGRGPEGTRLVACLRQVAPSWLVRLPGLVAEAEWEALQRRCGAATPERMLRELAEAVEVWTSTQPLVLVLEDLHWSDTATLAWLTYVARRRGMARLLVVGTYRPADARLRQHPVHTVMQDLQGQGQGTEIALGAWSVAAVGTYLRARFGANAFPAAVANILHQRTGGNPLFLRLTVDDLVRQGRLREGRAGWELVDAPASVAVGVPDSVQQLILRQLAQLGALEQTLLAIASVAGPQFSAAAVAAGSRQAVETVEQTCHALARRGQFLRICGANVGLDGTVATCYAFLHGMAWETLYGGVPVGQRGQWQRQMGGGLETGHGPPAPWAAASATHGVHGQATGAQALPRRAPRGAIPHPDPGPGFPADSAGHPRAHRAETAGTQGSQPRHYKGTRPHGGAGCANVMWCDVAAVVPRPALMPTTAILNLQTVLDDVSCTHATLRSC